jgi:hypothetical protein
LDPEDAVLDRGRRPGPPPARRPSGSAGIVILPQLDPVVLAKHLASVYALSRGRVLLSIAGRYLEAGVRAYDANTVALVVVPDDVLG